MIVMDPPEHDRLRGAVMRAFTPRRMAGLEPRIREIARRLLADLPPASSAGEIDAFEAYTDPPCITSCEPRC